MTLDSLVLLFTDVSHPKRQLFVTQSIFNSIHLRKVNKHLEQCLVWQLALQCGLGFTKCIGERHPRSHFICKSIELYVTYLITLQQSNQ
jgi:hypothetical protein